MYCVKGSINSGEYQNSSSAYITMNDVKVSGKDYEIDAS